MELKTKIVAIILATSFELTQYVDVPGTIEFVDHNAINALEFIETKQNG